MSATPSDTELVDRVDQLVRALMLDGCVTTYDFNMFGVQLTGRSMREVLQQLEVELLKRRMTDRRIV